MLWQYRLWSFQTGYIKLEIFLPKNQHTQRKFLNFENWTNGEPQWLAKIRVFKVDYFILPSNSHKLFNFLRENIIGFKNMVAGKPSDYQGIYWIIECFEIHFKPSYLNMQERNCLHLLDIT